MLEKFVITRYYVILVPLCVTRHLNQLLVCQLIWKPERVLEQYKTKPNLFEIGFILDMESHQIAVFEHWSLQY